MRSPIDEKSVIEGLPRSEDCLTVFYNSKAFWRSSLNKLPFGGLLEDILQVFYRMFFMYSTNKGPFKGLL